MCQRRGYWLFRYWLLVTLFTAPATASASAFVSSETRRRALIASSTRRFNPLRVSHLCTAPSVTPFHGRSCVFVSPVCLLTLCLCPTLLPHRCPLLCFAEDKRPRWSSSAYEAYRASDTELHAGAFFPRCLV